MSLTPDTVGTTLEEEDEAPGPVSHVTASQSGVTAGGRRSSAGTARRDVLTGTQPCIEIGGARSAAVRPEASADDGWSCAANPASRASAVVRT